MRPFEAVIFDLDGLVLDTEQSYFAAWHKAVGEMGFQLDPECFNELSGRQYQDVEHFLIRRFGHDFDLIQFRQTSGDCWHDHVKQVGISVMPGVLALLESLQTQKIPYALATNSQRKPASDCLTYAGLNEVFSHIVARDDVADGKPHPEIFFRAGEMLKTPLAHCLILEDSLTGIQAAAQTEAISVLIPSIQPIDCEATALADFVFTSLIELLSTLSQTFPQGHCLSGYCKCL